MKTHHLRRGAGHGQGRQEQQAPHFVVVELENSHGFLSVDGRMRQMQKTLFGALFLSTLFYSSLP